MAARRPGRWLLGTVTAAVLVAGTSAALLHHSTSPPTPPTRCVATAGGRFYPLDLAQTANAATIASVGLRMGAADHAVTVALATALQESKLHDLPYGDRDSVGLFQQRPSQGWGSRTELLDPHFAATAFYTHLLQVPGWSSLPVTVAAQAVQHSAAASAYAAWEDEARALARALTGEVGHGLTCSFQSPTSSSRGLSTAVVTALGVGTVGWPVSRQVGWQAATWLVAQAAQYGVSSVSFDGWTWSHRAGRWTHHGAHDRIVRYTLDQSSGTP